MRKPCGVLVVMALCTLAACGDDEGNSTSLNSGGTFGTGSVQATGGATGMTSDLRCDEICELGLDLACPNDDFDSCLAECEGIGNDYPSCISSVTAYNECALALPASAIECDADDGEAVVKPGNCADEEAAVIACATAAAGQN